MIGNVKRIFDQQQLPQLLLRTGLAFVFFYAAVASIAQPFVWSGFLPGFLSRAVDPVVAVRVIALCEILLALWLISGRMRKHAALVAALMLAGITLANINQFIVTFRDIGLLCAALALFFA